MCALMDGFPPNAGMTGFLAGWVKNEKGQRMGFAALWCVCVGGRAGG